MFVMRQTATFEDWFRSLKDHRAKQVIAKRFVRIEAGLLGDVKSMGKGVSEIRINYGPGYRIYYTLRGMTIIILLCGGTKSSQSRDICQAQAMVKELDDGDEAKRI